MKKHLIIFAAIAAAAIATEARTVGPLVSDATTVTTTAQGKVQGYKDGDIYTFNGIPYAKAERFMPPQAPDKHDGVLMTRNYGPKAPQPVTLNWKGIPQSDNDFVFKFGREPLYEKPCLVLNIWTKGLNDGKKRPVFVWFHGGGFHTGSGHD
ncbi:MAG: carboxylesterase family protein, partial [Muribaculaceae bacterium]|nr:carboxylesterase family protein [Muribaculaceae bacterium]